MSLASRPRRVKFGAIIIILLSRMLAELEKDNDGSPFEQLVNLSTALKPQMAKETWSEEEEALYDVYDGIGDALDPGNLDPSSETIATWPGMVEDAIAELGT